VEIAGVAARPDGMEAGEDTQFLDAMRRARIKGALVGVESVTEEGLWQRCTN